jgi:hypothetical protein
MDYLIFGIILLHIIVGFGWLIYKMEIQKEKPKNKDAADDDQTKK